MIFIVPNSDERTATGPISKFVYHSFPFGVAALASVLDRDGINVKIANDAINELTHESAKALASTEPGFPVFGLTSLTLQVHRAKQLQKIIKEAVPEAKIIVGGIHATALPEEFLDDGFDFVFSGEAELVITELATLLSEGKDVSHIHGLVWKDSDGRIHKNPPIPTLIKLEDLPLFPFHLFEDDLHRYDIGVILSSRGCPYKCTFCSQRVMTGTHFRTRPIHLVLSELDMIINKYSSKHVYFIDDNMVVNRKWTRELSESIIKNGWHKKASFLCQMRADAARPEILRELGKANFKTVSFGIETGSERVAKIIEKGETVEACKKAVKLAKELGFKVAATFIIGFPTETNQERVQTVEMALDLNLDVMRVNIAIPYPGTPLYYSTKDKLHIVDGWKNFNVVSPIVTGPFNALPLPYVPEGSDESELRFLMLWTNLKFWISPKGIKRFFFSPSTGVTRPPSFWYLNPEYLFSFINIGISTIMLVGWVAALGVKYSIRKLFKPKTQVQKSRN